MILFLAVAGLYSAYALWDNAQVYAAVDNVQSELLALKPTAEAVEEDGGAFPLRSCLPSIRMCAPGSRWTAHRSIIQSCRERDNLTYVNTDVYGDFALAGSIFLDSRCDRTFHEKYTLLYGHHMDNSKMSAIWICMRTRRFLKKISAEC